MYKFVELCVQSSSSSSSFSSFSSKRLLDSCGYDRKQNPSKIKSHFFSRLRADKFQSRYIRIF